MIDFDILKVNPKNKMIIIGILIIVALVGIVVSKHNSSKEEEKAREGQERVAEMQRIQKEKYEEDLSKLITRLGNCTIDINLSIWNVNRLQDRFLVFEDSKIVVINQIEYCFSQILGYSLIDDATSETITTSTGKAKTSTGNMIGRAVVGGVLTGGIGAVAGAATAQKKISTDATSRTITSHKYTICINVDSLESSTINIHIGKDTQKAYEIANILNVIIERTKKTDNV